MAEKCPKCEAKCIYTEKGGIGRADYFSFACGSWLFSDESKEHQSQSCRIAELEAIIADATQAAFACGFQRDCDDSDPEAVAEADYLPSLVAWIASAEGEARSQRDEALAEVARLEFLKTAARNVADTYLENVVLMERQIERLEAEVARLREVQCVACGYAVPFGATKPAKGGGRICIDESVLGCYTKRLEAELDAKQQLS